MNLKIKGIVLQQKDYLENQKYLQILTAKNGVLNVKLKMSGYITRSIFSNIYVAGFYLFDLFCGEFGVVVDDIEEMKHFFNLRFFPEKLALAQYFCELSYVFNISLKKAFRQMNLLIKSIWFIEKEKLPISLVKSIFELRLLSYSGHMPNLVCCKFCCCYEKEEMFFNIYQNFLVCRNCIKKIEKKDKLLKLTRAVLYAMRFIIYKGDRDIFKFRLEKKHSDLLEKIVESVVLSVLEKEPLTLKVYKQFKEGFEF